MPLDYRALGRTLDNLARRTWADLGDARELGIEMGEVSITDRNLLDLRREHPELAVRKHLVKEEARTGADWEWWIGYRDAWTCLVFQAKRLSDDLRYHGLTKCQPNGVPQVDRLIKSCWERSKRLGGVVWPLYCFYNSWTGGWPREVGKPRRVPTTGFSHADELPTYGCAVTGAQVVRQVVADPLLQRRKTSRNTYLPYCRPWSWIVMGHLDESAYTADLYSAVSRLSQWCDELPQASARTRALSGPAQWRAHIRARRVHDHNVDEVGALFIREPPQYVYDLLEGHPRIRALKPLANRVAVLPIPN